MRDSNQSAEPGRSREKFDAIVVGGGLAGLSAAAWMGRDGLRVLLLEKSNVMGGRARTRNVRGFDFNQGPHALYRRGAAAGALRSLGVSFTGGIPALNRWMARTDRGLFRLPADAKSLLLTRFFSLREKSEATLLLRRLGAGAKAEPGETMGRWLEREVKSRRVRDYLGAITRLSTYAHDIDQLDAEAALTQVRMGTGGVHYLDNGWQSLVDGLRACALRAGVEIRAGEKVERIIYDVDAQGTGADASGARGRRVRGVRLASRGDSGGKENIAAEEVILALDPGTAAKISDHDDFTPLSRFAEGVRPIHAATLDVALRGPAPRYTGMLDLNNPFYVSVHSSYGKLAPKDGVLVSAMKYGAEGENIERELEEALDTVLPERENRIVHKRFLPRMIVAHSSRTPDRWGALPEGEIPGCTGLQVCGDWVGTGMLADAALESARNAAERIIRRSRRDRPEQRVQSA